MYDIAYDVSEHSNSTDVNNPSLSEDDTPLVEQNLKTLFKRKDDAMTINNELSDHTGIPIEKIPYVGLRFDSLQWAQEFYSNYVKKVWFVTRIRNTNFDKTMKELKVPINQSIHCSREDYRESRVKAATRVKRITTAGCKTRMCVMLDKQNDNWMVSKLELKHTHTCFAKQVVHYSEYRELTMHAKIVIQNNDEASIRPNKTYLALANEVGGSSKLGYLETDVCHTCSVFTLLDFSFRCHRMIDSKGVVPCLSSSTIERQFQREYTTSKFREVQHEFKKRGDCLVRGVTQEGDLFRVTVNEQYLLYGEPRSWTYIVEFNPETHKVWYECNMFGSRGILCCHCLAMLSLVGARMYNKNTLSSRATTTRSDQKKSHNLFRRLCSHFYNVSHDFVTCEEEAAMLHSSLDQLRSKLLNYHANLGFRRVPTTQNGTVTQRDPALGESDIQGPSKASTKGRLRLKRLGSKLDI
ncbi:hypothetical protein Ahy_A01g000513 [Arachis hypogaea]|uniref:FAR1 domain-containing protein n=1 Tax=Arachis hypogaea TaxID=3818 RepID=A0A445EKM1_ARAHY|nr:hypothetical protein Ahy_A01g000513 [Arachis hypogaea]